MLTGTFSKFADLLSGDFKPSAVVSRFWTGRNHVNTLTDEKVRQITKNVATANNVELENILLQPAIASTGGEAIEITIVVPRGTLGTMVGERSARTISNLI